MRYGIITVPLYDSFGKEALDHILTLTAGKVLIESKLALKNIMKAHPDSLKQIEQVICFDEAEEDSIKELKSRNIELVPFSKLLEERLELPLPKLEPKRIFSISFTSGTTGNPKGVVLTHRNLISCWIGMKDDLNFEPTDVHLSYLPLAHSF